LAVVIDIYPRSQRLFQRADCLIELFAYSVLAEGVGIGEGTTAQPDDEGLGARGTRSKIEGSYVRPPLAP
jgi:hypothetical protein